MQVWNGINSERVQSVLGGLWGAAVLWNHYQPLPPHLTPPLPLPPLLTLACCMSPNSVCNSNHHCSVYVCVWREREREREKERERERERETSTQVVATEACPLDCCCLCINLLRIFFFHSSFLSCLRCPRAQLRS